MAYIKRRVLKDVDRFMRGGTLFEAAVHKAGMKSPDTFRGWGKKPQKFSRFWHVRFARVVEVLKGYAETMRNAGAEDALMKGIIEDRNPTLIMFYLMNKKPEVYRDRRAIVNNTNVFNAQADPEKALMRALPDKDLDDLSARIIERRKDAAVEA